MFMRIKWEAILFPAYIAYRTPFESDGSRDTYSLVLVTQQIYLINPYCDCLQFKKLPIPIIF